MKVWFEYDLQTGAVLRQFRLPDDMAEPVSEDGHGMIESPNPLLPGYTATVTGGILNIIENVIAVPTLDDLKAQKWDQAKSYRDKIMAGTCQTPSGVVQIDDLSKTKINGLVIMAMLASTNGSAFSIPFTLYNNDVVALDAPATIALGIAVGQFVAACQNVGTNIRNAIDSSTNETDLDKIDITVGYPS